MTSTDGSYKSGFQYIHYVVNAQFAVFLHAFLSGFKAQ